MSHPTNDLERPGHQDEPYVFNPFADGFAEDPYPHYAQLRATAPAHEHPLGFWILSSYESVFRLLRSSHSADERKLVHVPLTKDDPGTLGMENRAARGLSILDRDPPDHTRIRRLFSKALTQRSVDALEPRITTLVDEALDRMAEAGRVDLVAELAFPLPFRVISEMLGVPLVDPTRFRELVASLVRTLEPLPDPELRAEVRSANYELMAMVREMIGWKRDHPGEDLVTALLAVEHDGAGLTEDELVAQVMLLYIAGHETTVNLLGGGVLALLWHPDQYELLRRRPELAANAVDELLRYDNPVHLARRITLEPFVAHGHEIPAGTFVITCLAAANRDPEFWGDDAAELRLDRPNASQHLTFGGGVHHCLGAPLARLEGRVALGRFAQRFPSAAVEHVRWNGRINLRGPAELHVTAR